MLGILVVCYLFLGGAGSAALFLLIILETRPMSQLQPTPQSHPQLQLQLQRTISLGYFVCLVTLCLGALCLVADIGRLDRVLFLFTQPSPTYITVGAYALILLIICAGFLAAATSLNLAKSKRQIRLIARICGLILAAIVMVYTGLFLQDIGTVAFWASPIIPIIFVVSSFSTGIALLLGVWYFTGNGQELPTTLRRLARFDLALVVLEVACVAIFACIFASDSEIHAAAIVLTIGENAPIFWLGFVFCGLILPVFSQTILAKNTAKNTPIIAGIMALAVLVGGFSLRWCVILAGAQPIAQPLTTAWGL